MMLCMGCMSLTEDLTRPCPICGYRPDSPYNVDYLTPGTTLQGRYTVGKLLSHNCESALYIGFDNQKQVKVWIREFCPTDYTHRNHTDLSLLVKEGYGTAYETSLADFEELAHTLAKATSSEPVVPVEEVFKANNTIYIVYKYAQMLTFGEFLNRSGGTLSWQAAKKLFMPLFTGLSHLHARGVIHGGICPDNLMIDTSGKLWLWGFSIQELRRSSGDAKNGLYSGYSAPEQYSNKDWQGSWTDVYSAAATLYRTLTGTMPIDAVDRKKQDSLTPAYQLDSKIPESVSDALSAAMVLDYQNRTQSIDELTANLLESVGTNTAVFETCDLPKKKRKARKVQLSPTFTYLLAAMGVTLVLIGSALFYLLNNVFPDLLTSSTSQISSSETESSEPEPLKVPSLIGLYIETIKKNAALEEIFDLSIIESYNEEYPSGVVFDQTPPADTSIPDTRGKITLYVSKGPEAVPMPNLVGSSLEFAMDTLTRMGIMFDIIEVEDENADTNIILSTDKEPGTEIRKHKDTVTLYIKEGSDFGY